MKRIGSIKDLGAQVRAKRKKLGYTQGFLAAYAGVSASFLSDLENGKETIQLGKALLILHLLGMDLCVLERGRSDE